MEDKPIHMDDLPGAWRGGPALQESVGHSPDLVFGRTARASPLDGGPPMACFADDAAWQVKPKALWQRQGRQPFDVNFATRPSPQPARLSLPRSCSAAAPTAPHPLPRLTGPPPLENPPCKSANHPLLRNLILP